MDAGDHPEMISDDDEMPPLEEAEDAQHGDIPLETVPELENSAEIDFFPTVYACDFCGAVFAFEAGLIVHKNTSSHHFCIQCDRRYSSWARLLQHLEDSKTHNFCSECELDFPSPRALRTHLQSYLHASYCRCITLVLIIPVLVVLMGILGAFVGGKLRH